MSYLAEDCMYRRPEKRVLHTPPLKSSLSIRPLLGSLQSTQFERSWGEPQQVQVVAKLIFEKRGRSNDPPKSTTDHH
eukprot:6457253-Amphidinium_carterae.1